MMKLRMGEKNILEALENGEKLRFKDIMACAQLSRQATAENLRLLLEKKFIKKEGEKRKSRYFITEKGLAALKVVREGYKHIEDEEMDELIEAIAQYFSEEGVGAYLQSRVERLIDNITPLYLPFPKDIRLLRRILATIILDSLKWRSNRENAVETREVNLNALKIIKCFIDEDMSLDEMHISVTVEFNPKEALKRALYRIEDKIRELEKEIELEKSEKEREKLEKKRDNYYRAYGKLKIQPEELVEEAVQTLFDAI